MVNQQQIYKKQKPLYKSDKSEKYMNGFITTSITIKISHDSTILSLFIVIVTEEMLRGLNT